AGRCLAKRSGNGTRATSLHQAGGCLRQWSDRQTDMRSMPTVMCGVLYMLIDSFLFHISPRDGRWLGDVLQAHEEQTLRKIAQITSLEDMTDAFLDQLVNDSIVDPLVIHDGDRTHHERNENIPPELMPYERFARRRGVSLPMQVSRISI